MRRFAGLLLAVAVLGVPPVSAEHDSSCAEGGGTTIEGVFDADLEGDWVMVPFGPVPEGCHRLEVRLTHDQVPYPDTPVPGVPIKHTLDLAVYEPAGDGELWGRDEFRGYGGSGETDIVLTEGANTTRGFTPGPIPAGIWAAELGLASIASITEGDEDGRVAWTLAITWSHAVDPDPWITDDHPDDPVAADGWYEGDLHVHGPHSNDARDMSWDDLFDAAFTQSGLDFIAVSDHNVTRPWAEIGAQEVPEGKLVIRSEEVTTYRGHVNSHAASDWIDYRTGRIWQWDTAARAVDDEPLRDPVAPGASGGIFDQIHRAGGWTQVNHPTTFPSPVPGMGNLCRGCPWEYSDAETDWSKVDAIEVATGPGGTGDSTAPLPLPEGVPGDGTFGPNPFTPLAIEWFDRLQRRGFDITAVGSSDSHRLNEHELTHSPIGEATTVVRAPELSERGIRAAIDAGHAYVKMFGAHGPDLRFAAQSLSGGPRVIMGDEMAARAARFHGQVIGPPTGPGTMTLHVFVDGIPTYAFPVPDQREGDVFEVEFVGVGSGDYRLQLMRGTAIEAVTNPINLGVDVPGAGKVNQAHRVNGLPGRLHGRP